MSGNKLLAENTIRRFMKLANVDTMTDNFISENFKEENLEEEVEETNEDINEQEEEINEEDEIEVELEEAAEDEEGPAMDDDEMEADMADLGDEGGEEMGAADMSLTEEEARLLIDLGERLSAAMGGAPEDAPEMDGAADLDSELDLGDEEEEPAKAYMESMTASEQESLVSEILKRVTKRLVAAKRK
tara:strand:+ start:79 stop:642 length:564 start_codon:yes stop_codon:yes gene_type:complete